MAKKKKKQSQKRRQKKLTEKKKKRAAKASATTHSNKPKQLTEQDLMAFYKDIENPDVFAERLDWLVTLVKKDDYFADLKFDASTVRDAVYQFIEAHDEEVSEWDMGRYTDALEKEVFSKHRSLSKRMDITDIFDRATRSPRFSGDERDAVILGHLLLQVEQQKEMMGTELPDEAKDMGNPIFMMFNEIAMEELAQDDERVAAFVEKVKALPEELPEPEAEPEAELVEEEAPELPLTDELPEAELESLIQAMNEAFAFRFELDEMLHLIAQNHRLTDIQTYLDLEDDSVAELIYGPIHDDFSDSHVSERYINHLTEHDADPESFYHHALVYVRTRNVEDNPFLINTFLLSINALRQSDDEPVQALLTQPQNLERMLAFGQKLAEAKDQHAAIRAFRRAVELDREDYRGYEHLAGIYEQQENWDLAAENYEIAIDMAEDARDAGNTDIDPDHITALEEKLERVEENL